MKNKLTAILLVLSMYSYAQPTFDNTQYAPNSGDEFTMGRASAVSAGPSGASQTWDFSSSSIITTEIYTVNAASSVPCSSDYTGANQAVGTGGNFDMIDVTSTEYNYYGTTLTPSMSDVVFSNPRKTFQYPMSFNDNFSDNYFGSNTSSFYRYGNCTVTYDGYGTILTPYGTYSNVIRIHVSFSEADSTGGSVICSANRDFYYWYSSLYRYPVAKIWNSTGSCSFSAGCEFLQSVTIGIEEKDIINSFDVFPNITSDFITLFTKDSNPKTAYIHDINGVLVKEIAITEQESKINISDLSSGIYLIRISHSMANKIIKL